MFKLFFIDRRSYITEMGKATVVISNAASGHDFSTDAYLIGLLRNRNPVHRFSRINTDFFCFPVENVKPQIGLYNPGVRNKF